MKDLTLDGYMARLQKNVVWLEAAMHREKQKRGFTAQRKGHLTALKKIQQRLVELEDSDIEMQGKIVDMIRDSVMAQ
jgi:hypothetical protein